MVCRWSADDGPSHAAVSTSRALCPTCSQRAPLCPTHVLLPQKRQALRVVWSKGIYSLCTGRWPPWNRVEHESLGCGQARPRGLRNENENEKYCVSLQGLVVGWSAKMTLALLSTPIEGLCTHSAAQGSRVPQFFETVRAMEKPWKSSACRVGGASENSQRSMRDIGEPSVESQVFLCKHWHAAEESQNRIEIQTESTTLTATQPRLSSHGIQTEQCLAEALLSP